MADQRRRSGLNVMREHARVLRVDDDLLPLGYVPDRGPLSLARSGDRAFPGRGQRSAALADLPFPRPAGQRCEVAQRRRVRLHVQRITAPAAQWAYSALTSPRPRRESLSWRYRADART